MKKAYSLHRSGAGRYEVRLREYGGRGTHLGYVVAVSLSKSRTEWGIVGQQEPLYASRTEAADALLEATTEENPNVNDDIKDSISGKTRAELYAEAGLTPPKRYVVMGPSGPTPFETDFLQEAVEHIVMHTDRFVWDRHEDKMATVDVAPSPEALEKLLTDLES